MKNNATWIAILEDQEADSERLRGFLKRYGEAHGTELTVSVYRDGMELLSGYDSGFDILFMDIELPRMNGMQTAERVRQMNEQIPIIFTTNMAQYAIKGYEVGALGFMVKPVSYILFENYLTKALSRCRRNELLQANSTVMLGSGSSFRQISVDEIVCIIKEGNYLIYRMIDGEEIRERGAMKNVLQRFEGTTIKQCATGCLVNLCHVRKKERNEVYLPGVVFTITMPFRKSFTQELMNYMRGA